MHGHPGHDGPAGGGAWSEAVPLLVVSGVLLVLYLRAAAGTRGTSRHWSVWRGVFWVAGCVVVALAVTPSPADQGDPRVHMAQHVLLGMVAPLALVLGRPVSLLLRTVPPRRRRTIVKALRSAPLRVLGHPVTAASLSTGTLYAILLTPLYTAAGENPVLHTGLHLHYLAAGFLFAFSLTGADPIPHLPGLAFRVFVLFLAIAAHAVLAKYLYAHAATPPLGAHHDPDATRDAARLMYYGGDVAELLLATAVFATWYGRRSRVRPRPSPARSSALS